LSLGSREIYLVWHEDVEYRFSKYMKPNFKHVFAIERHQFGWVCLDPNRSNLDITILPALAGVDIMPQFVISNPGATILKVTANTTTASNYPRPGIVSCVSSVQYYLGVYWPWIFTPHSLYTKLKNKPPKHIKVDDYVGKLNS